MDLIEEKRLVAEARLDPAAFGKLYDQCFDRILNYVYRRTGDADLARDITSEVFIKAYTGLWKFKWRNISIMAWFYRIASNEIHQFYRSKNYRATSIEDVGLDLRELVGKDAWEEESKQIEEASESHQQFEQIRRIVLEFDRKYQEVLTYRYFEKLSIKEICEITGKKEGTVKSLISRGLEKIRKEIE